MEEAKNNGTWIQAKYSNGSYKGGIEFDLNSELALTEKSEMFLEIRNLLMMTIIPKKMDIKDNRQSAYLKAAVSRVKIISKFYFFILFFRFATRLHSIGREYFI